MSEDNILNIVTRLRDVTFMDWEGEEITDPLCDEAADEIEQLRAALALACGLLSTYYAMSPPDQLMQQFLEEARRG
jgi:hypothetical protein